MCVQIQRSRWIRASVPVLLCILVFLFALHAKTAVYGGTSAGKVSPSAASKLWVTSEKMEFRAELLHSVPLFWLFLISVFGLYLSSDCFFRSIVVVPSVSTGRRWRARRFLRPPPVQG